MTATNRTIRSIRADIASLERQKAGWELMFLMGDAEGEINERLSDLRDELCEADETAADIRYHEAIRASAEFA